MRSTPSSADDPRTRRLSRSATVALVVVSVAIPLAVLALIVRNQHASSTAATRGPVSTPTKAKVGSVAPDFTLPDLDGKPASLSDLRGRPVVLTFFASWCNPCEQDMPALEQAQHANGDRIAVVGVNYKDFPDDTRAFVHRLGVTFPTLIENSSDNPVAKRYGVNAMPDTLFIDAHGVVRDRIFGETTVADLQAAVDKLLHP